MLTLKPDKKPSLHLIYEAKLQVKLFMAALSYWLGSETSYIQRAKLALLHTDSPLTDFVFRLLNVVHYDSVTDFFSYHFSFECSQAFQQTGLFKLCCIETPTQRFTWLLLMTHHSLSQGETVSRAFPISSSICHSYCLCDRSIQAKFLIKNWARPHHQSHLQMIQPST